MRNGDLIPEPSESQAVQYIFNQYEKGCSLNEIAKAMMKKGLPYSEASKIWNKNMVKRILENEKYLGKGNYARLIDNATFKQVNVKKKKKSNEVFEISEGLQAIRKKSFCSECGYKISRIGGNSRSEKWNCRNKDCTKFEYRVTDQMLIGAILNILNTVIANPKLLTVSSEISTYQPSLEITRQQNEINRLMDHANVDFDKTKQEIFKLAQLKYACCDYNDRPQKTAQLMDLIENKEQLNIFDLGLFKNAVKAIRISHFYVIEVEFINGVTIKNMIGDEKYE